LDGLSGFGTTSQMFDAAYWRAKEGELARTILAIPQIKSARVHISQGATSAFQRDQGLTASVTVTTANGSLSAEQAEALRHLIASATGNMQPADVSVIDSVAGFIPPADETATGGAADARAEEIKRNVERLLAARVGPGKAVVEVSLDIIRDREVLSEKTIDPQARVAISSETEQSSDSSTNSQSGVTVASNLPAGNAAGGNNGQSQASKSRERVNFEVSQKQRDLTREPGAIRRLTVAVLVDGVRVAAADGTLTWQPRSDGELSDLRELVSSASGLDESRGDVLTLKSMEFSPIAEEGTLAEPSLFAAMGPIDLMTTIQWLVLAVVSLLLGLFVVRPLLTQSRGTGAGLNLGGGAALALSGPGEGMAGGALTDGLTGEISEDFDFPSMPVVNFDEAAMLGQPSAGTDPVSRLRRLIDERQTESLEILRNWMEKEEERS
jgi:flagellar M-ring protein FliF